MRESKYFRMALMFGDNNASTFNKNLEKMIALALHEKYDESLTIVDIIDELKSNYGLDFSESEILSAIQNRNQTRIICISNADDNSSSKYTITPEEKERIDNKISNTMIYDVISQFIHGNADISTTEEEFGTLLKRYFYSVFNSNANTLSELLDHNRSYDLESDVDFSENEKTLINTFLEWNNSDKDKCVYMMVSCCCDYCMMTVKRDKNIYKDIFRKKNFYLDSNIVFRMMGLNRENRRKLIYAFIEKCKEVGVNLRYTNHTRQELYDTIDFHVGQIRELLEQHNPISVESVRSMTSKFLNLSFYEAYAKWCEKDANIVGDYKSFSDDLKIQVNGILKEFSRIEFDDFQNRMKKEFDANCSSLKAYKSERRKYASDEIVKTDINNYMFIRQENEKDKASDFFGTHSYLISADHVLGDWARAQRPSSIPIVVLPSVWYSLILQYTGRTDDDFASYARFLNFSMTSYYEEDPRKIQILKKVISLDEPKEIKERTIFDIEQKLSSDYRDLDSIDTIVESSHEYILDQERRRITQEIQQQADSRVASVTAKAEAELSEERARHAKEELEATEKNKQLLSTLDEEYKKGAKERTDALVDRSLLRTVVLYWIVAIVFIIAFVYFCLVAISKYINKQWLWLPVAYESAPAIVDLLISVLVAVVGFLVFQKCLCGLDRDKIRSRLIEKYSVQ